MGPRDSTALACQHWVQARPVLHPLPLSSESLSEVSWISFPLWFSSLDSCLCMSWLGSCCSKQGMRPGHCSPPPWKTDSKAILVPTAATHTHIPHKQIPYTHTQAESWKGPPLDWGKGHLVVPKVEEKGRGVMVGGGREGCIAHVLSSGHHFLLNLCGASQDRSRLAKFRKWSLSQRGKCGSSLYMHPAPTKMTPCLRSTSALHP